MELSITHLFLIVLLLCLIGYTFHKKKIQGLKQKVSRAESEMLRSDKDYLTVVQVNEILKDEIVRQQSKELIQVPKQNKLRKEEP
jgi:predicted Holliday junction resolvase-like endonuclease